MLLALLLLLAPALAVAAPIDPEDVYVIDGDTVTVFGAPPNVRLIGLNAPETHRAQCAAEWARGIQATQRLREIVHAGQLDFAFVACATEANNYGRRCGTLKANGKDVGAILIAEGLAVPFRCGGTRCPATPRPWCERR
jgi:endonuclease YncB( thermonuclease family)